MSRLFLPGHGLRSGGIWCTATARSCGSSSKPAARCTCCASRSNFTLTLASGVTATCAEAVSGLLTGKRAKDKRLWEVRSAGKGSKGDRWYAWAWLGTASPRHHLLIRRHLKTGDGVAPTAARPLYVRAQRHAARPSQTQWDPATPPPAARASLRPGETPAERERSENRKLMIAGVLTITAAGRSPARIWPTTGPQAP